IASASAAAHQGLEILARDIQTRAGNSTRFVEVALHAAPCAADVPCKTSLMLITHHAPGSLAKILGELARRGVNLTKLESRPHPQKEWHYRFYLDLAGHAASQPIADALAAIEPLTEEILLLGTYPAAGEAVDPAS
ncbi:MAG: ACT domain-containing protein, partial [Thermoanaerobaculia bacterium]|nr:ACT domain-containing protein [Thermoanaerobaculia bacterium]